MAERHSIWAWIGIGCVVLTVVGIVVVVGGGYWLFRETKQFAAKMDDPLARTASALDVLGAASLPEGYFAEVGFSMPFGVVRIAVLSDQPLGPAGQPAVEGGRGLIYVDSIYTGQDERALADYFEGRTSDPSVLRDNYIDIDIDEILDRGVLELGGEVRASYLAQRGSVSSHGHSGRGLMSTILVDCPHDQRMRVAVWFGPDTAEASLAGTPADPQAIAAFLRPFSLCPRAADRASS